VFTKIITNRLVRVQVIQARGFIENDHSTDVESIVNPGSLS